MTEKRQTSQGYIIRILQHFATKLWNITNFVMLFQAVMNFCPDQNFSYKGKGPFTSRAQLHGIPEYTFHIQSDTRFGFGCS
jgi:hypothetical protein